MMEEARPIFKRALGRDDDKLGVLHNLEKALKCTRQCSDLLRLRLDGDTVEAVFGDGSREYGRKRINVEGDSGLAMIADVAKGLL